MRCRLVLTGAAIFAIAAGLWLGSQSSEVPRPFASVRRPERTQAQVPEAQRAEGALRTARLPQPALAGEQGEASRSAPDAPRRLRDPITLARALLLHASRGEAGEPTSRAYRIRALQRDLASLTGELRAAAAQPTDERLSEARSRFHQAQSAAAELFPEPSPPPPSAQAALPAPLPGRMRDLTPPRPAPPGVIDRGPPPSPGVDAPETQLRALLAAVDAALAEALPEPASLEQVTQQIEAALVPGQAGRGPALRYSAARFGKDTP